MDPKIQSLSQPTESIIVSLLFCFELCSINTCCLHSLVFPTFLFTANTDTTIPSQGLSEIVGHLHMVAGCIPSKINGNKSILIFTLGNI